MNEKMIITISRQYGSGGRSIGKKLAEELAIPFYDKELISLAAKESGFEEKIFENADKQGMHSLLYSLSIGMYNTIGAYDGPESLPLNDRVFLIQHNVIRELAQKGSCVIVGRCSDYVLRSEPNAIHIFVHSDLDSRVKRAVEEYEFPPENAASAIQKADKRRAAYYEYYTGARWGRLENYDLTLNSDRVGIDNAVQIVKAYAMMHKDRPAASKDRA